MRVCACEREGVRECVCVERERESARAREKERETETERERDLDSKVGNSVSVHLVAGAHAHGLDDVPREQQINHLPETEFFVDILLVRIHFIMR